MKFLHCADLHIDSPLRGLARYEGAPIDEIRAAARHAFDNLVDLAVDEAVACLVIAGDLYDGDRDDYNTALFLQRHFERLRDEGIAVTLACGNHDAVSEITRRLRPPDNVHVFSHKEAQTYIFEEVGLAFHGRSYPTRDVADDLSATYPDPIPGLVNVGVLHTCLDGRPGHDSYAPCRPDALVARGYRYWALGHVHAREVQQLDGAWLVFPGNLQGRNARETGPKGATLVTYSDEGIISAEPWALDVVRWLRLDVNAADSCSVDDVLARASDALSELPAEGPLHAIRLCVVGATRAHDDLWRERDQWVNQLRADAMGAAGRVWLEKVEINTRLVGDRRDAHVLGDAVGAVHAVVAAYREDESARADLLDVLAPLRSKLGADLKQLREVGMPDISSPAWLKAELDTIEMLLVAQLQEQEA